MNLVNALNFNVNVNGVRSVNIFTDGNTVFLLKKRKKKKNVLVPKNPLNWSKK